METYFMLSFPAEAVNEYSRVEKGPGRPPHWEMVFWWTRKPLASARAAIAAALLPSSAYPTQEQFLNDLFPCRHERKTVHACNPSPRLVEKLRGKKLLDPFAGFGSIPLEALRLGLDVTAVELLPAAYVFLKAILEYPHRYSREVVEITGREVRELGLEDVAKKFSGARQISDSGKYKVPRLIYDVARWGRWAIQQLREDPDIKELYDEDVAVYIGTWEVKCPAGDHYTPLVGNWWLARVKSDRKYERLAWMTWRDGKIEIVDLNEKCRKSKAGNCGKLNAVVKTKGEEEEGGSVEWSGTRFAVPAKNIDARSEEATCLHCRVDIDHRVINGQLKKPVKGQRKEGEWYVKWALRQWNTNLERYLNGEITFQELRNSLARPILLIKVKLKNNDLEFEPTTPQDAEKLWKALEKLKQIWGDPDIPTELIANYENRSIWILLYGFDKWFKLFNPRQLLTLVKLVKLIREAGKRVEEEKLREGWSREEAFKYAEAITTYLAIALVNHIRHNCVVTSIEPTQKFIAHALAFRGIAMTWNWVDEYPIANIIGSYARSINSILESLEYIISAVSGSPGKIKVLLDDATTLNWLGDEKFDVIVTDPPYADDVPYAELSDFYFVWLKRALSDVGGGRLVPRFLQEAFFDEFGEEIPTQWKVFAPREVSESEGRREYFKSEPFEVLLARAFTNLLRFLKEDGHLVVYYVAKKPEAWVAFVKALWEGAGLELVAAHPVATESEESVVARGKASVLGGYLSVWRRRRGERPLELSDREAVVKAVAERFKRFRSQARGARGHTLWVYAYLAALSFLTEHWPVKRRGAELRAEELVEAAVDLAFEALLRGAGVELADAASKAYLALRLLEGSEGRVDSDVLSHVERAVGVSASDLVKWGLVRPVETGGARVAKRKVFEVLAPRSDTVEEFKRVYAYQREKSPALDCLRQLQLNAVARSPVSCSPVAREEAERLARALLEMAKAGLIDEEDADVKAAKVALRAEWWA